MNIGKFLKEKKLGLSFLLIFFVSLVISLINRNIFHETYQISIFFVVLIFIFSQYFDFDYRLLIGFTLFLLIICPFLLIFKLNTLAEYFATYVYGFLVLGIVGYFFDNLREKLKSKGTIKIYKKVFLSILVIFLLSSAFIFVRDFRHNSDYTVVIRENFIKFANSTKDKYIRTFKKDIYYSGRDVAEVDGKKISRNIIINIDNPKADSIISKTIDLSGWAIETNSIYNTGIDRIEFFLDGKPGKGKYLGQFSHNYKSELVSKNYIVNLYNNFYNRQPTTMELNFWAINLEYNIMSYYEVANNIINESKFMEKSSTNEDFLRRVYAGLLNKDWDVAMLDRMKKDLTRADILYILINSEEFKINSEIYNKNISLKKNNLDIIRKNVGEKYGKQFYLSGFNFQIDSTKYKNGKHTIYVYAHSPVFGWDYKTLIINKQIF
ncbi:MAG: DUF4214 domain-containing protein [Candidatus Humimicrobiaceae bacterium]